MRINELIESARETMDFSAEEMAKLLDITYDSYLDIEDHDDELYYSSLDIILLISEKLELDLSEMIKLLYPDTQDARNIDNTLQSLRVAKGFSVSELSDIIGFYEIVIEEYEEDHSKLFKSLPLFAVYDLAKALGISILDIISICKNN